jgi:hypothetical protein
MKIVPVKSRVAALLSVLMLTALPASTLLCAPTVRADEPQANEHQGDEPQGNNGNNEQPRSGVAEGILTGKGEGFILVRADGERESTRLLPRWIGGTPKQGGGIDKQMLLIFQQLVVGSRLKVAWIYDEHYRAVKIQVLQPPGQDNENNGDANNGDANNGDPKGDDGNAGEPQTQEANTGAFDGVLNNKGPNWISARPDGKHEATRFVPRWIGGTPAQGGSLDKDVIRAIEQIPVGARIHVEWLRDAEHLRVVSLRLATPK